MKYKSLGLALVYSGPHYGHPHRIIGRDIAVTWVQYYDEEPFAVSQYDLDECPAFLGDTNKNEDENAPGSATGQRNTAPNWNDK